MKQTGTILMDDLKNTVFKKFLVFLKVHRFAVKLFVFGVLGYFFLIWLLSVMYAHKIFESIYPPSNLKELGAFGDFFGGIINPLLTTILIIVAYLDIRRNRQIELVRYINHTLEELFQDAHKIATDIFFEISEDALTIPCSFSMLIAFSSRKSRGAPGSFSLLDFVLTNSKFQILLIQLPDLILNYLIQYKWYNTEYCYEDWWGYNELRATRHATIVKYCDFLEKINEALLLKEEEDRKAGLSLSSVSISLLSIVDHKIKVIAKIIEKINSQNEDFSES